MKRSELDHRLRSCYRKIYDWIVYCDNVDSPKHRAQLRRSARIRPVLVLTGAYQTGKTSTLRRLFPDYVYS